MPRCPRAVVSLLVLAAALPAAERLELRNERGRVDLAVADEVELLGAGAPQTVQATGRDNVREAARKQLATGRFKEARPVVYLDGRIGDPAARVGITRQLLVAAAPGTTIADLAAAHGLRLTAAVADRSGWFIAEPQSDDLYAALDAARALAGDARTALAWPMLELPVASRGHVPNDPIITNNPGLAWHYTRAPAPERPARIRPFQAWDHWDGEGLNVHITDGGVQTDHPDLEVNYRPLLSYDYANGDADPRPYPAASNDDNHGTAVAGLILARGENGIGSAGVAYKAGMVVSKLFNSYNASRMAGLPSDAIMDRVFRLGTGTDTSGNGVSVINCAWGPLDDASNATPLAPLVELALQNATASGRNRRGAVFVVAAGNGGWTNPNTNRQPPVIYPVRQDNANFDAYLNRYVIPVGAYDEFWAKEWYSEHGSNLIIAAPAPNLATTDRTTRTISNPNPTFDNLGYWLWPRAIAPVPPDLDGDGFIFGEPPPPAVPVGKPFENGDYGYTGEGTSYAAALVSGAATLMVQARPELSWRDVRQIMALRAQDPLFYDPPPPEGIGAPMPQVGATNGRWHPWGATWVNRRPGSPYMFYNNRYGFGGLDLSRLIYGGNGELGFGWTIDATELASPAALNEPGALRWPLLPAQLAQPLVYSATFPIPDYAVADATALFDAPNYPPSQNLVPDGRPVVGIGSRLVTIPLPIAAADVPDRFRIDSVELKVTLSDVGPTTYKYPGTPLLQGAPLGFRWSDYAFYLRAPNDPTFLFPDFYPGAILGRQRNDSSATANAIIEGQSWTWTFTEFRHMNDLPAGTWNLYVIDEVNSPTASGTFDDANGNPPQSRVSAVELRIYGHQTYAQPHLTGLSSLGVASDGGDQTLGIDGTGFGVSQGGVTALQAYWQPLAPVPGPPVEIPTTYTTSTRGSLVIPDALTPTTSPGSGYVFLANPAVVIGRSDPTGAPLALNNGIVDVFDGSDSLPTTVSLPDGTSAASNRWMKRCPGTEDRTVRYSRRPTLTPINDIYLPSGGAFSVTTTATDPDVLAALPVGMPESLTMTINSYNPGFSGALTITSPGAPGVGTYTIAGNVPNNGSGFAFIEVRVTDGVVTTTETFRVIIPTDEDGSGCGGGMGLALIGVPLAAWFIRRRRRG